MRRRPLSNKEAVDFLSDIYRDPAVSRADEPVGIRPLWLQLAERPDPSPNIWLDAYLAAFSLLLDAEVVTFDRGFKVYEKAGLKLHLLDQP